MATATTTSTEPTTSQIQSHRSRTQLTNTPTTQLERSAAQRLRTTCVPVKRSFPRLGSRKTLASE